MKLELLALERPLQIGAERETGHHPVVHRGLEQAVAALPLGLGDVHRGIGVADQLVGIGGVARLDDRDAEAGADDQVVVVELERTAERVEDPLGGLHRRLRVVDVLEQDRELVAAEPGGGVGRADACRDALSHLEQDPVADGVTEAVVDGLEVVEIDEQHGHAHAVAQRPRDRVADALVEQRPIGEVGDGIVEGLVGELLLERLALGDVAAVEHDPADRAVGQQISVEDLEVAQASVLVREQAVDHLGAAGRAGAVGEAAQQPALLVGMEQLLERPSRDLLDRVAEHALDRRALVEDRVVGVEHRDQVARVLDERREPSLAGAPVNLGRELGAAQRERDLVGERAQRVARLVVVGGLAGEDQHQAGARGRPRDEARAAERGRRRRAGAAPRARRAGSFTVPADARVVQERRDLGGDRPLGQSAALVERHRALLIAEDPAHAGVDAVLAELGDRLKRRDHDVLRVRGRDQQAAGGAERPLARDRLLALADEPGHAGDDEREQNRRRADDEQQIPVAGRDHLDDLQRGRDQGRAGEQRESQPGQPWLAIGLLFGELLHRGCSAAAPQNR